MHDDPRSARLAYRRLRAADVAAARRHWSEPAVRRFLWDDAPVATATVEAVFAASAASFARAGFGIWLLDDGAPGLAGTCGLRTIDGCAAIEVLYSVDPARWGRGLATEVAHAVLQLAFTRLGIERVHGVVDEPNAASRRVLEKLGMAPVTTPAGTADLPYYAVERARFLSTLA